MIEQNDPTHMEACFILAVMLERKRVIKNKDQIRNEDGGRTLIYEHTQSGDVFTILDPALKLAELGDVQAKVAELLEHGLHPPDAVEGTKADGEPEPVAEAVDESGTQAVADLQTIQQTLGHDFRDLSLLRLALTHPSASGNQSKPSDDNQQLEFLGGRHLTVSNL